MKSVTLISKGTWDSMRALSRMSLYTGLVRRRSKMDIWAGMFPRCSKILYWLFDGADETGGPAILNYALRVVTAHSLLEPWILITVRIFLRENSPKNQELTHKHNEPDMIRMTIYSICHDPA